MYMNIEIASIIFENCIVPEPATISGTGLLLDCDTGTMLIRHGLLTITTKIMYR